MANKTLFASRSGTRNVPVTTTVNEAGSRAYALSDKHALAQLAVTGCLNGTFYVSATDQLKTTLELANKVDPIFVAKIAVYSRKYGKMKDMPALLLANLASRGEQGVALVKRIFPEVITNTKMLRNFFQIIRSGTVGRKNFGTALRKLMAEWLSNKSIDQLFDGSIGNDPTLVDVMKLSHVKPVDKVRENFHNYLFGREFNLEILPERIRSYEGFKRGLVTEMPNVPFDFLTSLSVLTDEHWKEIAKNAPWNMTRMNLNTFARHNVFKDEAMLQLVANRLRDKELVSKFNVFPYQLMTALQNVGTDIPYQLKDALQDALDSSIDNVPSFDCNVAVCVDTSSSMSYYTTGNRGSVTSKTRCIDVAALIASAILRKNKNTRIVPFDTRVHNSDLNPRDSVWTNATKLASYGGGGTNCASALKDINDKGQTPDLVIYVSDNESWAEAYGHRYRGNGTGLMEEFNRLRSRNKKAKMVLIDITPHKNTQAPDNGNIMNVGGFSDSVFDVIASWMKAEDNFVDIIEKVSLTD